MKLFAVDDNVILELPDESDKLESGIIKVEYNKKDKQGKVVSVGNKSTADISVGDTAIFHSFSGRIFERDYKKYMTINSKEILGVIRD